MRGAVTGQWQGGGRALVARAGTRVHIIYVVCTPCIHRPNYIHAFKLAELQMCVWYKCKPLSVCVCVCMCLCVRVSLRVCMSECVCMSVWVRVFVSAYVGVCVCVCVCDSEGREAYLICIMSGEHWRHVLCTVMHFTDA